MPAGNSALKADYDRVWGYLAKEALAFQQKIEEAKAHLDTKAVADLVTAGYSSADANTLKSAAAELASWGASLSPTFTRQISGPSSLV